MMKMNDETNDPDELYITLAVRFRNQEDLSDFAKLIGDPSLGVKNKKKRTKTHWYPLNTGNETFGEFYE
jgi:hypothetical protein